MNRTDNHFFINENLTVFNIPNVAIFLIQNGNEIFVSPHEGAAEDQIRLYLLGTCMGAILIQRRILPLHGSAIAINGKAYAIVGDSGAGKSTTASALLRLGYELISDDVIPVSFNEQGIPMVTPAYPQQKLWQESIDEFGMESSNFRPIIDRETKFAIPVSSQFCDTALPLAGVFELIKTEDETLTFSSVTGLERFHLLFQHTYRNFFIPRAGLMEWHFQTSAKMVNKMSFYRIQRPTSYFTTDKITDFILTNMERKGEVVNG
ncbi:energy-coupling factor transporter ATP-binding protein EcfA2 [Bacillus tianshenii]|uniref:Energy-coupling factor transporter ATP-binding protein EcfA2 n=1 Tax=Sutcliffiella tianshenii TaxID=1463404 RepID=A0ABS2NUC5_9BACI|nr:energy-coupling factor transporter ATP-binding protein EcfA2 [Bacillus tianshenii]